MMNRAVFFDRDGVLNVAARKGEYIKSVDSFTWCNGAIEIIKKFKERGYLVIVITNQRGVALGCMNSLDVENIHNLMNLDLKKEGTKIDAFYYCPHDLKDNCTCRKPKPGLILTAIKDYSLEPKESYLVGDSESDIEAGNSAGIKHCFKIESDLIKNFSTSFLDN